MCRFACSLVLIAGLVLLARADIPPPPPAEGFKRVPYQIVMKLGAEIPGYRFFTFSQMGLGAEEEIGEELKLGTETAVAVPSSSSPSVRTGVVAVPDKVMAELRTKESVAKLLTRTEREKLPPKVVIYETRGTIADLKLSDPRTKVERVVTITADEKAGVVFTGQETPAPPAQNDESDTSSRQAPFVVAGVAAALAVLTLGIWWIRRVKRLPGVA